MRAILWLLLAMTFVPCAWAEWTRAGGTERMDHYVDLDTKRTTGNIVQMWVLHDYRAARTGSGGQYLSEKLLMEFNCSTEQLRRVAYVESSGPMGGGAVVGSRSNLNHLFEPVVPGSVGATKLRIACGGSGIASPSTPSVPLIADFDVVNRSSQSIISVFVSPVNTTGWGTDRLGDKVLGVGERFKIEMPRNGQCQHDVRVEYVGRFEERRNQDLCVLLELAFDGSTQRPIASVPKPSPAPGPATARGQAYGTGFFISSQGHALTNDHVTDGCRSVVAHYEGRELSAEIIRRDARNDLALLRVQTKNAVPHATFRAGPTIKAGEAIVVAGFPLPDVLQNGINVTVGNVSSLAGIGGNTALLQLTAPVQPGNSGGPVLDMGGNIVGIVVSKLNATLVAKATGDIPQNVNFAVHGAVAKLFLESAGHQAHERSSTQEIRVGEVGTRARAYTFQLDCRR